MFRQHLRSRDQSVHHEGAEQDRHACRAWNAEYDGWHERAALARAGGAFRGDDAAHVAFAPKLVVAPFSVFRAWPYESQYDDRRRYSGDRAYHGTDPRTAHHEPPMDEAIHAALPETAPVALLFDALLLLEHRRTAYHEVTQFRQGEDAQCQRHQRHAFPQVEAVQCPA